MKIKKINTLTLKKSTVANLSPDLMIELKGGGKATCAQVNTTYPPSDEETEC